MRFSTFAASVQGKKYRERGLPCQDFARAFEFDDVQAIAVADGHGGKDYFRSETGSRLAVQVAFEQVKKFCDDVKDYKTFSENGIRNFELKLWEEWQRAVKGDWLNNPFNVEEERWQLVSDKYKARYTSGDERYIPVAYGSTLLCAVSIGSQVLVVQIGDGSCVVLQRDGEFKLPVPPDGDSFGYVTTSLCEDDGYKKFRHVVLDCSEDSPLAPVAIFLSTDGLDDCYPIGDNDMYLYKLYADTVIDSMISNGFDKTRESLRLELLPYMTEHGSNDDISLAYLVTDDLDLLRQSLKQTPQPIEVQTPQPVEVQTPQPVEVQTPQPVEEQTPQPVEVQPSQPVEEQTPQHIKEQTPQPIEEQTPQPVEEQTPQPIEVQTPQPVEEQTPQHIEEQTPRPVEEVQAKVAEQAAQVRERLLPLWWLERSKQHDKQP